MFIKYWKGTADGTADRDPDGYSARPQSAPADNDLNEIELGTRGFSLVEIGRLRSCRRRFQHGDLNEWGKGYKRLLFAQWLYEHGRLTDTVPGEVALREAAQEG